ncbi:hypothetical protein DFH09DRAFT_1321984 [Mycena vulgaris]|nr:hypothetical protein DFH09DRAFT_1321984 [Mycena vulgaris]
MYLAWARLEKIIECIFLKPSPDITKALRFFFPTFGFSANLIIYPPGKLKPPPNPPSYPDPEILPAIRLNNRRRRETSEVQQLIRAHTENSCRTQGIDAGLHASSSVRASWRYFRSRAAPLASSRLRAPPKGQRCAQLARRSTPVSAFPDHRTTSSPGTRRSARTPPPRLVPPIRDFSSPRRDRTHVPPTSVFRVSSHLNAARKDEDGPSCVVPILRVSQASRRRRTPPLDHAEDDPRAARNRRTRNARTAVLRRSSASLSSAECGGLLRPHSARLGPSAGSALRLRMVVLTLFAQR